MDYLKLCSTCQHVQLQPSAEPCCICNHNHNHNHWSPPTPATKHDNGKLPMSLVPPEAIEALAEVLLFGAEKYGDRNWESGIEWSRLYDAAQRHLTAYLKGERLDPESGKSHLKHALANLAFLVTFEERGMTEHDNLPKGTQYAD